MEHNVFGLRGQVSIEFILIVLIALVYITSVVQPMINYATNSAEDVGKLSEAKLAAEKTAETINEIGASSGTAKKTLRVFVPKDSSIECVSNESGKSIEFKVGMSELPKPGSSACEKNPDSGKVFCQGQAAISSTISLNCDDLGKVEGRVLRAIEIEKKEDGTVYVK